MLWQFAGPVYFTWAMQANSSFSSLFVERLIYQFVFRIWNFFLVFKHWLTATPKPFADSTQPRRTQPAKCHHPRRTTCLHTTSSLTLFLEIKPSSCCTCRPEYTWQCHRHLSNGIRPDHWHGRQGISQSPRGPPSCMSVTALIPHSLLIVILYYQDQDAEKRLEINKQSAYSSTAASHSRLANWSVSSCVNWKASTT